MIRIFRTPTFSTFIDCTLCGAAALNADGGPQHQVRLTRPILLGVSGGSINDADGFYCCGGTFGGLVQAANGKKYILSNNHVLGRTNRAAVGEDSVQPGRIDVSCQQRTNDIVADFTQYIPIQFGPANLVDAAIAEVRPGMVDPSGTVLDIGTPSTSTVNAFVGLAVQKSGRTTGRTVGSVAAVNVTVYVTYPSKCGDRTGSTALFNDQFRITPGTFSAGGDSGSVIFENTANNPRAVGLLFAGSSSYTLANRIQNVLSANWSAGTLSIAGGAVETCGNGNCGVGEDECSCPQDCGAAPTSELDCNNSADDDCDDLVDCDDGDCFGDPACPSCGDATCNGDEDTCSCPEDCGAAPATETTCTGGVDEDCDGQTDCNDADCAAAPACQGPQAIVNCITYTTTGGGNRDKHLVTTITIVDANNNPLPNASVSATISNTSNSLNGTGTTNGNGAVSFTWNNAPNNCYHTNVTAITGGSASFDGTEPANGFQKGTDATPDADCRSGGDNCGGGPFGITGGNPPGFDKARNVKQRNSNRLLNLPDVVGHGISADANGNPVIEVYLKNENAATRAQIPTDLEHVPVKIIITGEFIAE